MTTILLTSAVTIVLAIVCAASFHLTKKVSDLESEVLYKQSIIETLQAHVIYQEECLDKKQNVIDSLQKDSLQKEVTKASPAPVKKAKTVSKKSKS